MDDPEAYHYDGACLAKAEEMGHPDIVSIIQKQVQRQPPLQGICKRPESGTRDKINSSASRACVTYTWLKRYNADG